MCTFIVCDIHMLRMQSFLLPCMWVIVLHYYYLCAFYSFIPTWVNLSIKVMLECMCDKIKIKMSGRHNCVYCDIHVKNEGSQQTILLNFTLSTCLFTHIHRHYTIHPCFIPRKLYYTTDPKESNTSEQATSCLYLRRLCLLRKRNM